MKQQQNPSYIEWYPNAQSNVLSSELSSLLIASLYEELYNDLDLLTDDNNKFINKDYTKL